MEPVSNIVAVYRRAADIFGALVHRVQPDQWTEPTPCAGWDVRQLVNHVAGENAWAPPLLAGRTIADVGDSLDGDLLGADAGRAWDELATAALAAAAQDGVLDRVVHVSFGDIPGSDYLSQIAADHIVHGWDLARGIGAPDELDAELVSWVWAFFEPQVEQWRGARAFGPTVDAADDAPLQVRLLALTGRAG